MDYSLPAWKYLLFGKWGAENLGSDDDAIIMFYFPFLQLVFIGAVIFMALSGGEGDPLYNFGIGLLFIWVLFGVGVFSIMSVIFLFDRIYGVIICGVIWIFYSRKRRKDT